MSLFSATTRFLSVKPSISASGGILRVRTSALLRALGLFAFGRTVWIDSRRRTISVETRRFWIRSGWQTFPFARVEYIDYDFSSLPTAWSAPHGTTDQVETYTVSLVLKEPREEIEVASFHGEGSVMTGWEGVFFSSDSLLDWEGDQGAASLTFVEVLKKLLGVPLGKQIGPIRDKEGKLWRCSGCGRNSPPKRERCQYCGGTVKATTV